MTLPKLNTTPTYDVIVPSTKKHITFRPYLVKEEKVLMIAFESGDQKQVTRAIGNTLNACINTDIDVFDLTTFDIEFLFTKIRSKSVGERSDIILTCDSEECSHKNEVSVNIDELTLEMGDAADQVIQLNDELTVEMGYPKFGNVLDVKTTGESIEDGIGMVASSINAICSLDERYSRDDVTQEEMVEFIMELTTQQFNKLSAFLATIPKLEKDLDFKCESCGKDNTYTLSGMRDFLA